MTPEAYEFARQLSTYMFIYSFFAGLFSLIESPGKSAITAALLVISIQLSIAFEKIFPILEKLSK